MFTGLIQRIGTLASTSQTGEGARLTIQVAAPFEALRFGESIAVDGVCLTVVDPSPTRFTVDVSPETLRKTTLGDRHPGARLNLERALRLTDRLGGHIVTGHVDRPGRVVQLRKLGQFLEIWFEVSPADSRYLVEKGSVAVDGVSLTVAECRHHRFSVSVIPTTLTETTLADRRLGETVNIETDILAKYVEKLLGGGGDDNADTDERLRSLLHEGGFLK